MRLEHGVTRTVLVGRRWAVKVPSVKYRHLVRGWLANRSEWKQLRRPDVMAPALTFAWVVQLYRAADFVPIDDAWWHEVVWGLLADRGYDGDESKPSSWGRFDDRWLLIDYDRAWRPEDRGWVGGWYHRRQEQLAFEWTEHRGDACVGVLEARV